MTLVAEAELMRVGFESFMPATLEPRRVDVLRFYKKRTFVLNMTGIVPYAGAALTILDVWGKGQFILSVARRESANPGALDESWKESLENLWPVFEPVLWDGPEIIACYERTSGTTLSSEVRVRFVETMATMGETYKTRVKTIGGFDQFQDAGEEVVHRAGELAMEGAKRASMQFKQWFS